MKYLQKNEQKCIPFKTLDLLDIIEKYRTFPHFKDGTYLIIDDKKIKFCSISDYVINKICKLFNFKQVKKLGFLHLNQVNTQIYQLEDDYFLIILVIFGNIFYYKLDQLSELMNFLKLLKKYNLII